MGVSHAKLLPSLGFLTVLAHRELGLFGGYLATTADGRPLEFHCTTPVKPSRAQEILYGPTLRPYLYGELIGGALLKRSEPPVALVLTDVAPALAVRDFVDAPVALVTASARNTSLSDSNCETELGEFGPQGIRIYRGEGGDVDSPRGSDGLPPLSTLTFASWRIAVRADRPEDRAAIERLRDAPLRIDLLEPLARIREAICEAQRISMSGEAPLVQAG